MASAKDVVLQQLQSGRKMIETFTGDLSDEEYFKPAAPNSNHAGWIVGHLAVSEDWLVSKTTGKPPRIEQALHELLGGSSQCIADASKYPSRSALNELFYNSRANTVEALKQFDERRWDEPAPEELPKEFFPTLGAIWGMQGVHQYWHIGQLTTCRRALNKKLLLG